MAYEFKVGDRVKVTRKAVSHERGWENMWVYTMNKAVGNIGTVRSINEGLKYDVTVAGPEVPHFGYPSFVLELFKDREFKIGQKVEVFYNPNSMWNGVGIVQDVYPDGHIGVKVNGMVGGFKTSSLTILAEPKPAIKENTLETFKIGDRVYAPGRSRYGYDSPSTVVKIGTAFIYIKSDQGFTGGFYPESLKFSTEPIAVASPNPVVGSVFSIAKNLAVEIAKSNTTGDPIATTNADQVQARLTELGYSSSDLGNAAGVLFRGKNWKKVGTQKSARKGSHLREISNWQYIGD